MSAPVPPVLFTARAILVDEGTWLPGGGLVVEAGRVVDVCADAAAVRARAGTAAVVRMELGDGVLAAGTVNAHSHLELHALRGQVSPDGGFGAWVRRVIDARAATGRDALAAGVADGARRLLSTGTTAVGDIDSLGIAAPILAGAGLRVVSYREALDAGDPIRTEPALASAAAAFEGPTSRVRVGLSPHAPFTVSPALFAGLGLLARERDAPVTIHWSETEAEIEWLTRGSGPLASLLGGSPGVSGLDLIEAAGLLGPRTSLVHGNHPAHGEAERIAAAGATLVHCPGSHAFFAREPFPLAGYLAAGVPLALGTDSSASNDDLDMRREMSLLRSAFPGLPPAGVWRAATWGGARALGAEDGAGRLVRGSRADFALYSCGAATLAACLDELTAGSPAVLGVWVGGRRRI